MITSILIQVLILYSIELFKFHKILKKELEMS